MSHPDPCFDPENSYKEDTMSSHFDDYNYDYHDAFYGEDSSACHADADHEVDSQFDDDHDDDYADHYDDSMDGDHDSAMSSCGWGTDEDYGYYGDDDREDFHSDDGYGSYDD
jgi:hypothetical protein